MKIALVHEFLTQLGGAERVLQAFHELYPQAPVFTLIYDRQKTRGEFDGWDIRTSFLQKITGGMEGGLSYKPLLPLMPKAIESFDFSRFDLVLSDSSAFAKGIITKKPTIHICYCHTPTRYLWQDMEGYVSSIKYSGIIKSLAKFYLKHFLKKWDYKAAQRPDFFIANSRTVQDRIKKYYNRESEVIYPPVDTEFFRPLPQSLPSPGEGGRRAGPLPRRGESWREVGSRPYYLTASRLEPYKKIDLVIEAFNKLGLPLKVAGTGTEAISYKLKAGSNIEFLGWVSDERLRDLYCGAKAFIFPAEEDAGIMVLESLACGTPVIAYGQGGASEFIRDGENGLLVSQQTVDAFCSAAQNVTTHNFDPVKLRESVLPFDKEMFKAKISQLIQNVIASPDRGVGAKQSLLDRLP